MRPDAPVFHLVPASSLFKVSSSTTLPEGVMNPSQPVEPQIAAADQALLRMEAGDKSPISSLIDQSVLIGGGKQKKKSPKRNSPSKKRRSSSKKPATKRSPAKKSTSKSSATKKNKKSASKKKTTTKKK